MRVARAYAFAYGPSSAFSSIWGGEAGDQAAGAVNLSLLAGLLRLQQLWSEVQQEGPSFLAPHLHSIAALIRQNEVAHLVGTSCKIGLVTCTAGGGNGWSAPHALIRPEARSQRWTRLPGASWHKRTGWKARPVSG